MLTKLSIDDHGLAFTKYDEQSENENKMTAKPKSQSYYIESDCRSRVMDNIRIEVLHYLSCIKVIIEVYPDWVTKFGPFGSLTTEYILGERFTLKYFNQ